MHSCGEGAQELKTKRNLNTTTSQRKHATPLTKQASRRTHYRRRGVGK